MRCFCTEGGVCLPEEHYMADVSGKAAQILPLIDRHLYFTLSRPRQYGKTGMLAKLEELLKPRYYVLRVSFQDAGRAEWTGESTFVSRFTDLLSGQMKESGFPDPLIELWNNPDTIRPNWRHRPFGYLRRKMRELCANADRPIVLMIDDVDSASGSEAFLRFLGTLRENYLASRNRTKRTPEASFQSVILSGVTDIRNLADQVRPEDTHESYSPWNIAAPFPVDLSFSAEEIAGMLREYEADHQTGMDIPAVSQEIRRLTSGYPFIVSWLCMWLDTDGRRNWTAEGVRAAGQAFLKSQCPLLNRIRDIVERHADFN